MKAALGSGECLSPRLSNSDSKGPNTDGRCEARSKSPRKQTEHTEMRDAPPPPRPAARPRTWAQQRRGGLQQAHAELGQAQLLEAQAQRVLGLQLRQLQRRGARVQGGRQGDPGVHVRVAAAPAVAETESPWGWGGTQAHGVPEHAHDSRASGPDSGMAYRDRDKFMRLNSIKMDQNCKWNQNAFTVCFPTDVLEVCQVLTAALNISTDDLLFTSTESRQVHCKVLWNQLKGKTKQFIQWPGYFAISTKCSK